MKANNQSALKINNQKVILDYILKEGPTSRAQLSKQLGVSKPTISTNVNYLLENKILIEEGFDSPSVGKKGLLLHFNKDRNYVLVCDFISELQNEQVIISLCNLNFEEILTYKTKFKLDKPLERLNYLLNIQLLDLLQRNNILISKILNVVIGISGVVSDNELSFKRYTGEIYDISEICNKNFRDKVIVRNDIKLATIAEKHFGIGKNYKNFAFIWTGIAMNAGLILNDKIYNGSNFASGEIGLILGKSVFTNETCNLSEIASINGLLYSFKKYNGIPKDSVLFEKHINNTLTFDDVVSGVNSSDAYCLNLVKNIGKEFGKALYNLSLSLDLETLILNGDFYKLGDVLIDEIRNTLQLNPFNTIKIELSEIKNSIILGGFKIGVENSIAKLVK